MGKINLNFNKELEKELKNALAFIAEATQCESQLRIYWQNEICNYDEDGNFIVTAQSGWTVQALPKQESDTDTSFEIESLLFYCSKSDLEEISETNNWLIVLEGDRHFLREI